MQEGFRTEQKQVVALAASAPDGVSPPPKCINPLLLRTRRGACLLLAPAAAVLGPDHPASPWGSQTPLLTAPVLSGRCPRTCLRPVAAALWPISVLCTCFECLAWDMESELITHTL